MDGEFSWEGEERGLELERARKQVVIDDNEN